MPNASSGSVSQTSIDAFKGLDEGGQRAALAAMSPSAKAALLDGLKSSSVEVTSPSAPPRDLTPPITSSSPDSVMGGFVRRGIDTAKGIWNTFTPPSESELQGMGPIEKVASTIPAYKIGKGLVESIGEAGKQSLEYAKQAARTITTDPVGAGLQGVRSLVTAASALNPLATPVVTNVNKLEDQGRNREAIGQAAFDALTLVAGRKMGKAPTAERAASKLAYATHAPIDALQHVLPDIQETVQQVGKKPQTIGELAQTVQETSTRLDNHFNLRLQQVAGRKVVPTEIADALRAKADSLPRTAAAEASELRNAAKTYDQVWDLRELNADRMYRNDNLRSFYNKDISGQMSAARSNASNMIDKIVADGARDLLYDKELPKYFPGEDFRGLKLKQSSLLDVMDNMDKHIRDIEDAQARERGEPIRAHRPHIFTSIGPTGLPSPHVFQRATISAGAKSMADVATRTAFGPTPAALARRAAVLGMPVAALGGGAGDVNSPPQQGDQK